MAQGLELMLAGMGTVFVFLTLLVGATLLMSRFAQRYAPDPEPVLSAPVARPAAGQPTGEEVAAISAAVAIHRSKTAQ